MQPNRSEVRKFSGIDSSSLSISTSYFSLPKRALECRASCCTNSDDTLLYTESLALWHSAKANTESRRACTRRLERCLEASFVIRAPSRCSSALFEGGKQTNTRLSALIRSRSAGYTSAIATTENSSHGITGCAIALSSRSSKLAAARGDVSLPSTQARPSLSSLLRSSSSSAWGARNTKRSVVLARLSRKVASTSTSGGTPSWNRALTLSTGAPRRDIPAHARAKPGAPRREAATVVLLRRLHTRLVSGRTVRVPLPAGRQWSGRMGPMKRVKWLV